MPRACRPSAVKDGNENYILNGEKWFSSSASVADMALVVARTDPNAPRHKQHSTFIVELPNPGYNIKRNIKNMAIEGPHADAIHGGHSEIEIKDLKVPADNLLGGEGNGFNMGQHRLAYGRLRHGMHNVAKAQRALDMAVAHITQRSTFGSLLSDRQGVQFMLADCASELYIGRLMLLHIAYKAEKGQDIRQENSIAKIFHAHMVHKVIDTAIQLHGALGFPRIRRWRNGTPRCARSGWSTVPTKCTSGKSARTSSRRSASTAPPRAPRAAICSEHHRHSGAAHSAEPGIRRAK